MNFEREAEELLTKLLGEDHIHQKDMIYHSLEDAYKAGTQDTDALDEAFEDGYDERRWEERFEQDDY